MTTIRDERGIALSITIMLTFLILTIALGTLSFIDRSQRRSGNERVGETTFNLSESLLNNEILLLSQTWPSSSAKAYPASCTAAATKCPSAVESIAAANASDVAAGVTWKTTIRDDIGSASTFYSKSATDAAACGSMTPCTWDSNGNGAVWLRADVTVKGKTRSVVGLARQQQTRISLPRNTITAGFFATSNNGNKTIIDEKGCQAKHKPSSNCNATDPAPLAVRCTTASPGVASDPCLGFRESQVAPAVLTQGYQGNVLPQSTLTLMKTSAIQIGTYYNSATGCPTATQASAPLVFIDGINCSYNGGDINSGDAPGVLVVNAGTISLGGNVNFYGVLFAADNLTPPADAGNLVFLGGNAYVQGSIFVEGKGGVAAGSSGVNVSFDPNALGNILAASSPVIAQNSFRELPTGQ